MLVVWVALYAPLVLNVLHGVMSAPVCESEISLQGLQLVSELDREGIYFAVFF